jgi:hypothetical protein
VPPPAAEVPAALGDWKNSFIATQTFRSSSRSLSFMRNSKRFTVSWTAAAGSVDC